jgi:hypothetical protein
MTGIIFYAVVIALGYGAYRIIRNGFRTPQSERLNIFGVFGICLMIFVAVWLVGLLAQRIF